jgi:tmRNA-binding protein
VLDCSIHLSSVFLFFQSLALVILLLSLTEGNIHLGSTVIIDKDEGRNNGETGLLAVLCKGKKEYDKRQTLKEKEDRREMDRAIKHF